MKTRRYVRHVDLELGWEADKVCIPGIKNNPLGCKGERAAPGRATLDRTIPPSEYRARARQSQFFRPPGTSSEQRGDGTDGSASGGDGSPGAGVAAPTEEGVTEDEHSGEA